MPLYRVFCQVTGFGGTPQRAETAPGAVAGQIGVRFDANIDAGAAMEVRAEQETVRIHPGARTTIYYRATNYTARNTTGQAIFNVTPEIRPGKYFSKIECFCFTEQTLKPGESVKDAGGVLRRSQAARRRGHAAHRRNHARATHFIRWKIRNARR